MCVPRQAGVCAPRQAGVCAPCPRGLTVAALFGVVAVTGFAVRGLAFAVRGLAFAALGVTAVAAGLLADAFLQFAAWRRFGGMTGDVFGGILEVSTATVLVACAVGS